MGDRSYHCNERSKRHEQRSLLCGAVLFPKLSHHGFHILWSVVLARCKLAAEWTDAHVAGVRCTRMGCEGAISGLMGDAAVVDLELIWLDWRAGHNRSSLEHSHRSGI